MARLRFSERHLSDSDLEFLLEANDVAAPDRPAVGQRLQRDALLRRSMTQTEEVFQRLLHDEELVVRISPDLYFEILLRKARKDLQQITHTVERAGSLAVPVFDTSEVLDLLEDEAVLSYLSVMLGSFTRVGGTTLELRGKGRARRRVHYSDLDIRSLMRLAEALDQGRRLDVYRRIGDVCLFMLGMFPDFAEAQYRYPHSGEVRPQLGGRLPRISPDEYQARGRHFYRLAAEHRAARGRAVGAVFWALHDGFSRALKPLNFISRIYLLSSQRALLA